MDPNEVVTRCGFNGTWTDEKHTSFLNWMEASFVKKMLFRLDEEWCPITRASPGTRCPPNPPVQQLDRYLPDSADSTLDSWDSSGGRRASAKRSDRQDISSQGVKSDVTTRKRSFRRCNVSQDQVVPQFGSTDAEEKNQRMRRT